MDRDRDRAAEVAARHGVPRVYRDLDELLADDRPEVVDIAVVPGVQVAVNHQLRYDEGMAVARAMVDAGWIGTPTTLSFTVDIRTDWSAGPGCWRASGWRSGTTRSTTSTPFGRSSGTRTGCPAPWGGGRASSPGARPAP
jgi:predicted dehydrogenase